MQQNLNLSPLYHKPIKQTMKKYFPILFTLSLIKLIIHCIANSNYGFHRDELLHLSVSEHLDWGYMEFPPFISWVGKLSYIFFDYSLWGTRLFPTLAGVMILVLCCLMAKELGGRLPAILLAGVCVLAFLPFYRNHTLFQPVAFDQLFWALGYFVLILFLNTGKSQYLLLLGAITGLGLLNKYTMIMWAAGVGFGLLFYKNGTLFKNKWAYIAALCTLLILLPNLIWQANHDFPFLLHLKLLKEKQLTGLNPMDFLLTQFDFPFTGIISVFGLIGMLFHQALKKYMMVSLAVTFTFLALWFLGSKAYYIFGIYPVLFAAGAVTLEKLTQKKKTWMPVITAITLILALPFVPAATPILPIEQYIKYSNKKVSDGRVELTGDYADMFGWEEQVKLVDSLYQSLSPEEQANCVIWAENYGEAGAVKILGKKYGLPNPISRHGSFWLWGYGDTNAKVWISLGNEKPSVEYVFEEAKLIKIIQHKYAIGEENNIPLYLCRKPKINIKKWWEEYKDHVFD